MGRLGKLTACCLLAMIASASGAAAATRIYSDAGGGSFPIEPVRLEYTASQSGSGAALTLKRLEWKSWGAERARGAGRLKGCVSGGECYRSAVRVTAKRLRSSSGERYYTKLRLRFGQQAFAFGLPLPGG